jgi:hypothetical protein
MNSKLHIPRMPKRRNPNWLIRFARWIGRHRRAFALYRFYRGMKNTHAEAWSKVERTL